MAMQRNTVTILVVSTLAVAGCASGHLPSTCVLTRFTCTNGESGVVRIEAGSGLSGEGSGESSLGAVHIVYGYPLDEINARMQFPEGKVLVQDERGIGLVSEESR